MFRSVKLPIGMIYRIHCGSNIAPCFKLAARWRLSVHTLRRWRQDQLGPIFCKVGSRVTYLISEIEAFERRVARYSTFARAYQ